MCVVRFQNEVYERDGIAFCRVQCNAWILLYCVYAKEVEKSYCYEMTTFVNQSHFEYYSTYLIMQSSKLHPKRLCHFQRIYSDFSELFILLETVLPCSLTLLISLFYEFKFSRIIY